MNANTTLHHYLLFNFAARNHKPLKLLTAKLLLLLRKKTFHT